MDTISSSSAPPDQSLSPPARYGALVAVLTCAITIVALATLFAQNRIEANERAWFVARLDALLAHTKHDNDLFADAIFVTAPDLLGEGPSAIYRARENGAPIGAILSATAPDGYGGPIQLLVAVDYRGTLLGVDVLHHNETQGIGDGFAPYRSDWLQRLIGHSLINPQPKQWTIRKDNGEFEQFTGASVSPRAILHATRKALEYYVTHRNTIFTNQENSRVPAP